MVGGEGFEHPATRELAPRPAVACEIGAIRRPAYHAPMTREQWTMEFAREIRRLRGMEDWRSKFADTLAQQQFVQHRDEDPVKVARQWVGSAHRRP